MFVKMHRVMCFIVTALLILLQITCQNNVEVQFLCKNEECSESIGEFTVHLSYNPDSTEKIHAKSRESGIILARPKDKSTDLWKVKINDRTGFIPIKHIRVIRESRREEVNATVNLLIPVNSALNSDPSKIPPTPDLGKDAEKNIEVTDAPETNVQTDDINSTVPFVEEIRNESSSSIVNDSSEEKNNVDVKKESISTSEPTIKTASTEDQVAPGTSSDDQTKKYTEPGKSINESLKNQQPAVAVKQNENLGLDNEKPLEPDVSTKLENTSLEINESEVVKVIEGSVNMSESSININEDISENLTRKVHVEEEKINNRFENISGVISNIENKPPINDISNTSESTTSFVQSQNDSTTSPKDLKESLSVENNTSSNSPVEAEVPDSPNENLKPNADDPKTDQVVSAPDSANVMSKSNPDLDLSTLNYTSQNSSTTAEVSDDFGPDVKQPSEDAKPDQNLSTSDKAGNETSKKPEFIAPPVLPPMRSFPDDKEPINSTEEFKTSSDEIITAMESDNGNVTSEEIDSMNNNTLDLDPSKAENERITESTPLQDPATPKEIPYEVHPPHNFESTTELAGNKVPISSEENFDSNGSVPIDSLSITSGSSMAEDTSLPKLSEPYKHKSQPYPSLFPNIASGNQPSDPEKSDPVSSQEIIETDEDASSESVNQTIESVSNESDTPLNVEQKQGLNDYIHSSRKKINEDEPEPIDESGTVEGKSIYETILEYLPDLSILSSSLIETSKNLFDFGSSTPKESPESEFCSAEQYCGTDRLNSPMDKSEDPESENILEVPFVGVVNKEQITFVSGILTTAVLATILLWWMLNYFNKNKKAGLLVSRINQLENKLLISTREIASLQNKLVEQDSQVELKQNVTDTKRITEVYEHKINQYKKRIVELDDKVLYLEKELENVSNSALEMHKLLENSLVTQAQSKLALDEVETLRALTESQENQIDELKREINSVVTENQCLKVDNEMNKSTIKKLEKECSTQTKKNVELSEKNRNLTLQLDKELENNNVLESNYKSEIYELRSKLEDVEMNLKRSDFQVQELQRAVLDKQAGVQSSGNDIKLNLQISTLDAMNKELSSQLNEQKNARRMLEDHVGDITKELNNLKKSFENSEKERNQAVTKLQVLTQYFKDKEEQLHKELEAKDKLSLERESKDQSLSQKLTLMREEISNLKVQNEELRKEVLDQEASYKVQLATAEQKTREHWFALRQAERKYKECQQEAAILRNKILVLETNMSSISLKADDKNNSGINGDIPGASSMLYHSSLSPDLLPYPSPSDFIPPPPSPIPSHSPDFFPPEPIYSPDERLPPLGGRRAPSPPPPISPDDDFGPPPPVMKFPSGRNHNVEPPVPGGYSRRTPPPSGRHRSQYKSRPPRSSIDSPSSGMSLESLDKSGR